MTREEYLELYPSACQTCNAEGGYSEGSTYFDPPEWVECPDCSQENLCPRCKLFLSSSFANHFFFDQTECPRCHYSHGKHPEDFIPRE